MPFDSGAVYVGLSTAVLIPITLDGSGGFVLPVPIPNLPAFVGVLARLQIGAVDPTQASGLSLSNGVELAICDN